MEWIWTILAGAIVGILGKWLAPGDKDNVPILLVIGLGILGVIIGRLIAAAIGVAETPGIDWIEWIIQIGLAVIFVMITSVLLGKRGQHKRRVPPPR